MNLVVVAAYVTGFLWRRDTESGVRATVGIGPLVLSLGGGGAARGGGLRWAAGWRSCYGVRVADENTQSTGYQDVRDEVTKGDALMVMATVALVAWALTAAGGFVMLGRWVAHGGLRQQRTGASRLPAGAVFTHLALAAAGLVLWLLYLLVDADVLGWIALVLLVPVAALGFVMLARWWQVRRGAQVVPAGGRVGAGAAASRHRAEAPAERHLPVPVVVAHGLLAVVTLVLVLATLLGVGGASRCPHRRHGTTRSTTCRPPP